MAKIKNTLKQTLRAKAVVKKVTVKSGEKIFDNVYRTMATKLPELMIPLINEMFGTNYRSDRTIEQLRNEFFEKDGKVITDSIFRIGDKLYHIEMQSTEDNTMAIRMMQYDFAIAISGAKRTGSTYEIDFPESCVVYLRNNQRRPKKHTVKLKLPNGQKVTYESRIINIQDYTSDEIFEKKLLLFLPYYIMRYQKEFAKIEKSKERFDSFIKEVESIRKRLARETVKKDKALLYEDLIDLMTDISDYLLKNQEKLRKEVKKTMGGEVLELRSEKLIKKAKREGRVEGRIEGQREGKREGTLNTLIGLVCDGLITVKEGAVRAGISERSFSAKMKAYRS